ncbi:ABC transporter ATP-binding protein [Amycolatopsis vastitatis]|uniref:Peptide ABC transporter ATP-binding protein n=1 Tax=Amycolatopsis vastitatis TaxID=1905142 RepID=A0A229SQQ7_9PSEU|nr:dipeptide/oligopeptide/nickel ABC transporter ATP-binding protein [Amycolatopsis vastitatis]OXM61152.1 peptide ABC transporter ATP-binding protein [Amycolatopsis vastitatis]
MPLLEVQDLRVEYRPGHPVVDGVNLVVRQGETLGLLGESGSGKSTIGHSIVGLVRPAGGRILFRGEDITHATARRRRELGTHLQIVFQDPNGSLNPSRTIGSTLAEPLRVVRRLPRRAASARVADVLKRVGMSPVAAERYPGAFSGGQLQRIAIARALVLEPELVVCDEPTSALDLSVQAQILNLLLDLQRQLGLSYLFISHDIDVVRFACHRVVSLRHGRIAEQGPIPA